MFERKEQAIDFHDYIDSRHPNIKFTFEEHIEGRLPFLDILIEANENIVKTSVFQKPTYTGLLTNFVR